MNRNIGAFGASVTLIGLVIGISIFILPGTLAGTTGPAVIVSYALASTVTLFACVVYAQLGCVFPVSGASFISISKLLSPFCGFASVWLMIGGAAVAISFLAYGFADYAELVYPGLPRQATAVALVIALAGFNLLGPRGNVLVQSVLVATFMLGLGAFAVTGLLKLDTSLLVPFAPNGWQPVFAAAIPAFFSFAGFMVIIDIGGEIRDPGRTIPLAIALSLATVVGVYLLVSLALVGTIPWQELGGIDAPVGEAASRILPGWIAIAIALSAVAAAASSIHALMLGYSRDVLALARAGILPRVHATLSRRGVPTHGVTFMLVLSLLALAAGGGIREFATLISTALLLLQIFLGLAAFRLPRKMPVEFRNSRFRLSAGLLRFCSIILIALSLAFLALAFSDAPRTALIGAGYLLVSAVYYWARRNYLQRRGVAMDTLNLPEIGARDSRTAA